MADTTLKIVIDDPAAGAAPPAATPATPPRYAPTGAPVTHPATTSRPTPADDRTSSRPPTATPAGAAPDDADRAATRPPADDARPRQQSAAASYAAADAGRPAKGRPDDATAGGAPRPHPALPERAQSPVTAFDRPQAVTIVGPRPLPVSIAGGLPKASPDADRSYERAEAKPKREGLVPRAARAAQATAQTAGQVTTQLAGNSNVAAATTLLDGVAGAVSTLGPVGAAAGAGLKAVATAAGAASTAIDAFAERGRELGKYNGPLAAAGANAGTTKLLSDIREADKLGPALAELIEKQAQAEATFREIALPVKEFLIETLGAFLDLAKEAMEGFLRFLEESRAVPKVFSEWAHEAREKLKEDKAKAAAGLIGAWLSAADGLGPTASAPDPIRSAADAMLAPPILGLS